MHHSLDRQLLVRHSFLERHVLLSHTCTRRDWRRPAARAHTG
jgi:hypothetical protein